MTWPVGDKKTLGMGMMKGHSGSSLSNAPILGIGHDAMDHPLATLCNCMIRSYKDVVDNCVESNGHPPQVRNKPLISTVQSEVAYVMNRQERKGS